MAASAVLVASSRNRPSISWLCPKIIQGFILRTWVYKYGRKGKNPVAVLYRCRNNSRFDEMARLIERQRFLRLVERCDGTAGGLCQGDRGADNVS